MAFQLYISDTPVDLDTASSISLSFVCPAFDDDSAERGYSLPFRLPHTPDLLTLLKSKQRLDTADVTDELSAKVAIETQDLAEGLYRVESSTNGFFDGHFENESRANLNSLGQLKIQNLMPTVAIPQTILNRWYFQLRPTGLATGYSMTIDGHPFATDNANSFASAINGALGETVAVSDGGFQVTLSPMADGHSYLIINTIPAYNGITLLSTSYTAVGAQRQNFLNFVSSSLTTPRTDMSFALMQNVNLYEGKNAAWSGLINFAEYSVVDSSWRTGFKVTSDLSGFWLSSDATAWKYAFVPFVRVSYILQKIAEAMGVTTVAGELVEWTELMTLLVYNNRSLDDVKQAYEFSELKYTNGYGVEIALKNHVPDMSAAEFLSEFCDDFGLSWKIDDERLLFTKKETLVEGRPTTDWSGYLVAGSEERGYKRPRGFTFRYKNDDSDKATSTALASYIEGEGFEVIELPAGTLPEKVIEGAKTACFSEQIRSESVSQLRFMFDRGVQDEDADWRYLPTASSDSFGDLSLEPLAVLNVFWKELAKYRAYGWSFKALFELPVTEIRKVLMWETAMRRIETPNGAIDAAINTIEVTEKVNGSAAVKVDFLVKN